MGSFYFADLCLQNKSSLVISLLNRNFHQSRGKAMLNWIFNPSRLGDNMQQFGNPSLGRIL